MGRTIMKTTTHKVLPPVNVLHTEMLDKGFCTVRSKCTFFVYYSFFLCVLLLVHSYFRSLFSFFCVNSGVYSFLLVFVPSLAFLCYFIFISAL